LVNVGLIATSHIGPILSELKFLGVDDFNYFPYQIILSSVYPCILIQTSNSLVHVTKLR